MPHDMVCAGQKQGMAVVVVVTKQSIRTVASFLVPLVVGISLPLMAAVLPDDQLDVLYHSYEGGGIKIAGPSVLIKKQVGKNYSFSYNYYVDSITSASVDVLTYGSPYTEERTEHDVGVEYLLDNTTMSLGYGDSKENDYHAKTVSFGISHDMFGELTTVGLAYSVGDDVITKTKSPGFIEYAKRYSYGVDISQILTKRLVLNLGFEAITDEGYLKNPYRRTFVEGNDLPGIEERYPKAHTSNAVALRAMYYLPYRAKVYGEVKGFNDSWEVSAAMAEVGYTHPFSKNLILDLHYRSYAQTRASFYFEKNVQQEYMSRDKELSTFHSSTMGVALNYSILKKPWWIFKKGTVNVGFDHLRFDYDDYVDRSGDASLSQQSETPCVLGVDCTPYGFDADVFQFYTSLWY